MTRTHARRTQPPTIKRSLSPLSARAKGYAARSLGIAVLLSVMPIREAAADDKGASASGSVKLEGGNAKAEGSRDGQPWIDRWPAEAGLVELGLYGGLFYLNKEHELFQARLDLPDQGYQALVQLMPDMGARLGVYPIRMFGIEVEGGFMPTVTVEHNLNAYIWTTRGHAVLQLGRKSIVPFLFVGGGAIGVASDPTALGNDIDPMLDGGGGIKFNLSRRAQIRLDVREVLTHQHDQPDVSKTLQSSNLEVTLGLSLVLGRRDEEPPPRAPAGPKDTDGDGIFDNRDECVTEPETVNDFQDKDGCPESDIDEDGFWDIPDEDACPQDPGVEPDGCPIGDTDGDGIMDPDDECVEDPETQNGFEDEDGCPDELPEEIEAFTGIIEGIYFDTDKATITPNSETVLNAAVAVLLKYPDIRVLISGHTDARGGYEHNLDLSRRRAASVRDYLIEHELDDARLETQGFGPDQPIDSNDTKRGRARNRRIEFSLLK